MDEISTIWRHLLLPVKQKDGLRGRESKELTLISKIIFDDNSFNSVLDRMLQKILVKKDEENYHERKEDPNSAASNCTFGAWKRQNGIS